MNKKEGQLAQIIADHDGMESAPEIVAALAGSTPTLPVLVELARFASAHLRPNVLNYALGFSMTINGVKALPHIYDGTFISQEGRVCWRGNSAWWTMLSAGAEPGDSKFEQVAQVLAKSHHSINASLFISSEGNESLDGGLISALACRGWMDQIRSIESLSGEKFNAEGRVGGQAPSSPDLTPLAMALRCGHGNVAKWLGARGAAFPGVALDWAATGLKRPMCASKGKYLTPSGTNRLAGMRLAACRVGFQEVDARPWSDGGQHTGSDRSSLMLWTMAKAAHAQAAGLPFEDRRRAVALWIAEQSDVPKKKVLAAEPRVERQEQEAPSKGFFSWLKRSPAPSSSASAQPSPANPSDSTAWPAAPAEIWARASELVQQRRASTPEISQAIEMLDQGMISEAKELIEGLPAKDILEACLALMGLAKLGFWDMGEDEDQPNAKRHPMRWAGFKMAIACAGKDVLNRPLAGLQGVAILGLASVLGFADACSEIIQAGAELDPDPLFNAESALSLATANGHADIAKALLVAGASPMEGARLDAFGFEQKKWAIHQALQEGNTPLVQAMLDADPRSAQLPDQKGRNAWEAASARAEKAGEADEKQKWENIAAMAQRAIIDASTKTFDKPTFNKQVDEQTGTGSVLECPPARRNSEASERAVQDLTRLAGAAPRSASTKSRL